MGSCEFDEREETGYWGGKENKRMGEGVIKEEGYWESTKSRAKH